MNTEVQVKWCDAMLATPEAEQGKHRLEDVTQDGIVQHCAVGVLAKLAQDEGILPAFNATGGLEWFYWDTLWDWAGINKCSNIALPSLGGHGVVYYNDLGVPWPVIVDAIKNDL